MLSGNGVLNKNGAADLTLSGNNTFSGILNILSGSLSTLGTTALGTQSALNVSSGARLNLDGSTTLGDIGGTGAIQIAQGNSLNVQGGVFDGQISGTGTLNKLSVRRLALTRVNTHVGDTNVQAGELQVDGSLDSGNVTVASGATLSGSGNLGGAVSVSNGATLSTVTGSTLQVGSLSLEPDAVVTAQLGAPDPDGQPLVQVANDLTLHGTLNVVDIGGFGAGVHRLFLYGGAFTDNGISVGSTPLPDVEVALQATVPNQVNLVVGGASNVLFWDGSDTTGNGQIDGGNGTWDAVSRNWTDANGAVNHAWNSTFAVFQGPAGTVTLDGSQAITGLQFMTDGYSLQSAGTGELLTSGTTNVRVDSGATATVGVPINGTGLLAKQDGGTLVLNTANGYSGGTALNRGALVVGNDDALGSGLLTAAAGTLLDSNTAVSLANTVLLEGALTLGGSAALTLAGSVSGEGGLIKNGAAPLTLTGSNVYSGGTQINGGSLIGNSNSLQGAILNNAALTFEQAADGRYTGNLTGSGTLSKNGSGELLLTGNNGLTGTTSVNAGSLRVDGRLDSARVQVARGARLGGSGVYAGQVLLADGASLVAGQSSTPLTLGGLELASGSTLDFALGAPDAASTVVKVEGNLVLDGTLNVTDVGGFSTGVYRLFSYGGALTDNGLALGAVPGSVALGDLALQTAIARQINLVVQRAGDPVQFWNGNQTNPDGSIGGGSGTWGPNTNWTNANGTTGETWSDAYAVFGGQPGTVTVVGNPSFSGLQFLSDGYQLVPG